MTEKRGIFSSVHNGEPARILFKDIIIPQRDEGEWEVRVKLQYSSGSLGSNTKHITHSINGSESVIHTFYPNDGEIVPETAFTAGIEFRKTKSEWEPIIGGDAFNLFTVSILDEKGCVYVNRDQSNFYVWITVDFRRKS